MRAVKITVDGTDFAAVEKFRHEESLHYHVFRVAILVQMDIMDGGVIFPV
jgi:hypothetical protein